MLSQGGFDHTDLCCLKLLQRSYAVELILKFGICTRGDNNLSEGNEVIIFLTFGKWKTELHYWYFSGNIHSHETWFLITQSSVYQVFRDSPKNFPKCQHICQWVLLQWFIFQRKRESLLQERSVRAFFHCLFYRQISSWLFCLWQRPQLPTV